MKRHDADAVSLIFGLIFVGLAAGWALARANLVDVADLQFAGPILLVVAGLIGLVVSLRRGRQTPDTWEDELRTYPDEPHPDSGDTVVLDRPDDTSPRRPDDTVPGQPNETVPDRPDDTIPGHAPDRAENRPPT